MPTGKGKGCSASQRYRPASEYDDATLAQKREYWRTKKREQRARLSERRGKRQKGEKLQHLNAPAQLVSGLSSPSSPPSYQSINKLQKPASPALQSGSIVDKSSLEGAESRKEQWFQTMKLHKVLPHLAATCSITDRGAGNAAVITGLKAKGCVNRAITSPTSSRNQLDNSSVVPPVKVTRYTNGSSTKTALTPRFSMHGPSVPKMQHKEQSVLRLQPKLLTNNVTTSAIHVSSTCVPFSITTECKILNATPQRRKTSALVTKQRAEGIEHPSLESEEERAAKRREQWRIKKREQRAKSAAQIAKAREKMQCMETAVKRQSANNAGLVNETGHQQSSSQMFFKAAGRRQCTIQAKPLITSGKRENDTLQSQAASLAAGNLQASQIKVHNSLANRTAQTAITSDVISARITGESQRKCLTYVPLSNLTRGIARCKTPRMRFIESQKNSISQRNIRYKSLLFSSVFDNRNIPKIDASDTHEQVIAKRREYWRIKKREQRAKLSMEVKARLKEKDSLMRRVKRYQKILDEIKKARALTTLAGSSLTHASETIGGFIKEDGTVTNTIPQGLTDHNIAAKKSEEENTISMPISQCQHQSDTEPLCHHSLVKATSPLADKYPGLSSQQKSSHPPSLTISQLRLTHPKTSSNALSGQCTTGLNIGGCVMKMAVSSTAQSPSPLSPQSGLIKEERMAKKREYWRIKKREQRAARAARLKQGLLHARATAALQRSKAQKQLALINVQLCRGLTSHRSAKHSKNKIKQESESMPTVDSNPQPKKVNCSDVKAPAFPLPPPVPLQETDMAGDSQATTLLAVASMKKLLEESLSTVTESKGQQTDIKMETKEQNLEQEIKQNSPLFFLEKNEVAPKTDLTLEIKNWQSDTEALAQTGSLSPHFDDLTHVSETLPPPDTSSEVVPHPACGQSSQATSNFIVKPSSEDAGNPSLPRKTQRLQSEKPSHQNCSSIEPPKLHHLPMDKPHPQQKQSKQTCQAQEPCQNSSSLPVPMNCGVTAKQSSLSSLQRKREYWKLMKRQQRARLKARQQETQEETASTEIEAPGLFILNPLANLNVQQKPSNTSPTAVPSVPTGLVINLTTYSGEQSPDTRPLINSVSCSFRNEQSSINTGSSQVSPNCLRGSGGKQQALQSPRKWMSTSSDIDSVPSLSFLKPPENPLSCINLQPIELPGQTSNSSISPIKIPCAKLRSPTQGTESLVSMPINSMVPPKQVPGESEEDFLRRKREYWRIKKKEQRARKAIRDKGIPQRTSSENWRPIIPNQNFQTQVSGQWVNSTEESNRLFSSSLDTNLESLPHSNYTSPIEERPEVVFPSYENNDGEDGPVSDAVWRNCYLMDYDPLNQLLVCMVCGDLQYSHSLEGVRAHIDEAHPDTLNLETGERQRILEAWDEQVSQRERFFTSQLQQHSGALAEEHMN